MCNLQYMKFFKENLNFSLRVFICILKYINVFLADLFDRLHSTTKLLSTRFIIHRYQTENEIEVSRGRHVVLQILYLNKSCIFRRSIVVMYSKHATNNYTICHLWHAGMLSSVTFNSLRMSPKTKCVHRV